MNIDKWKATNMPMSRLGLSPRLFKWRYKHFKKAMKGIKLKRTPSSDDRLCMDSMKMFHGGCYWPTTDGGIVALPYHTRKFDFLEWQE